MGEKERVGWAERAALTCALPPVKEITRGELLRAAGSSEGWAAGKEAQEGGDICNLRLIHVALWWKQTQLCKAIIRLKRTGSLINK